MIPLRDHNPTQRQPFVVYVFIAANVAVFLYQVMLGEQGMQAFIDRFGVVPYHLIHGDWLVTRSSGGALGSFVTPFTSMFMHGGWLHIISNMWFLFVFGDNVEDALGPVRFVLFYLLCGLGAVAAQVAIDPTSTVPMVGASGAIAGVLAGYVVLFPHTRVVTLVPIFIFIQFMELPAFLFIFVWFGLQLLSGVTSLGQIGANVGGVAFFAHIGGFLVGLVLVRFFRKSGGTRARFGYGFGYGRSRY